jgi:hypothetical protein
MKKTKKELLSIMEVLEDAKMIRAPKMMCGHKGGIHPGPGFAYLECDLCGGRWVTKVDEGESYVKKNSSA